MSSIAKKLVLAATGAVMLAFVVAHLMGNTTLFRGPDGINAYAEALHRFGILLWPFRLIILAAFSLHVYYGILLTIENSTAQPAAYAVSRHLSSTIAGRTMIWTGTLIAVFVILHLLHFTFGVLGQGTAAALLQDGRGRPDVFAMVVAAFGKTPVSFAYAAAMTALGLHLSHSIQSLFQTLGLRGDTNGAVFTRGGTIAAVLIALGFISFPLAVLTGLLHRAAQ